MASHISSIIGVQVRRGAFSEGTNVPLCNSNGNNAGKHRALIAFGRNGSGKSTIAREIKDITEGNGTGYFYDSCNQRVDLDDADRARIRVFNEDYIESKTRIGDDGLQAFAMLGEQVEVADEIKKIDDKIESIEAENQGLTKKIEELSNGEKSLETLKRKIQDAAVNSGWKSRAEKVDGKKPNFTDKRLNEICNAVSDESRECLDNEFNQKLMDYKKASAAGEDHLRELIPREPSRYDEARILELLSRRVEDPTLNDREKRILELVRSGHQHLIEESAKVFSSSETDVCPMCQRPIPSELKASIVDSVHKVLGEEVDKFKKELRASHLEEIVPRDVPEQVSAELKTKLLKAEQKANSLIEKYNGLMVERESSVYSPKTIEALGLSEVIQALNEEIKSINKEVESINKDIDEKSKIHDELRDLNNKIAAADVSSEIKKYGEALKEYNEALVKKKKNEDSLQCLARSRAEQEAKMKNMDIAVDVINDYLANVYFDTRRFQLSLDDGKYKIISKGQAVKPNDVSTGERNILALCYFFSESGKNRERHHEDDDPQYLILDDPISSFDMENRIGVCSLIRKRAGGLLGSNSESRITVMTHDRGVANELKDIFSDINFTFSGDYRFKTDFLELKDMSCETCSRKTTNEYVVLLNRAYKFACAEIIDPEESYVIGNILRRVLEGYSTFNYGIGMSELSRDPDLQERLGDQSPFLADAMYRLALNDGSHMEDREKAFNPTNDFGRYSDEEKRKCAQCVMVILYKLDSVHLKKHLVSTEVRWEDIRRHLDEWSQSFTPMIS